jgi:tetratricopeptide (TPR) repeat protein
MVSKARLVAFACAFLFGAAGLADQGSPGSERRREARVLGRLDFPTTTESRAAQAAFIQGVLFLHLFEYDFAELQFQHAQKIDPGFAMAYWGEAMVHNHPVWDEQNVDKGRAALNKLAPSAAARAAKTPSQKEKDYLRSLEVLYGAGTKAERDRNYMRHMEQMAQRYPDDREVRLFYALSIMGVSAGVRDIPSYMESVALSQSVFYANREHPGAAHYLIHGVDDPLHAPLGLEAARALAVMAPDAGHSLHMTSHIYVALGMWNDVVNVNVDAVRVENAMNVELGKSPGHWGHYNFFLLYGLLQQGRDAEAKKLLTAAYEETTAAGVVAKGPLIVDPDDSQVGSLVQMWARYRFETRAADPVMSQWRFNVGDAYDPNLTYHYVSGLLSVESDVIAKHLSGFGTLKKQLHADIMALSSKKPFDLLYLDRLAVIELQLKAALARANGDSEAAIKYAREASRLEGAMPSSFGPPFVDYPSAQMLGELWLGVGNYDEAANAFTVQLNRSRLKTQALIGLARAERARGNAEAADFAMTRYRQGRTVDAASSR